jgi:sporulation protein YlmC with PRC-barrel domain
MPDHEGRRLLSSSTLSGDEVYNLQNEKLGEIKDFMLDLEDGRIAYAVMESGGFLGMGRKLFAVPWKALSVDQPRQCLLLDMDRETLKNADGFDDDNWPDTVDPIWEQQSGKDAARAVTRPPDDSHPDPDMSRRGVAPDELPRGDTPRPNP